MASDPARAALVVSCLSPDLTDLAQLLTQEPVALLPVGGAGDLGQAAGVSTVLVVEIGPDGPRPAIRWRGSVCPSTPLTDPATVLPAGWVRRHPEGFARGRTGRNDVHEVSDWDEEDGDDDRRQLFLPISSLERIPQAKWVFANELVSKQQREGRTFAPRVPTIVSLPES